uniref:Uncharacterized protein n=1 Tax=Avena sativa TaxID=4498 RepID=A0ACD5YD59_AVESA
MADPRCHLLPTFLVNCTLILATYTLGATALSFNYNFAIPGDRAQLRLINASYAGVDRIILTDEVSNLTGRVAHPQPVRLWDDRSGRQASFTTTFHFAIHASSNVSRGDGMAFFIGPFPAATPPPRSDGGLLGLFSNPNTTGDDADSLRPPHTVAVEFDTCWNDGWDPSDGGGDHIGIDVNGIRSNWTRNLPTLSLNGTMWANITYDAESKVMKVTLRTIHRLYFNDVRTQCEDGSQGRRRLGAGRGRRVLGRHRTPQRVAPSPRLVLPLHRSLSV